MVGAGDLEIDIKGQSDDLCIIAANIVGGCTSLAIHVPCGHRGSQKEIDEQINSAIRQCGNASGKRSDCATDMSVEYA